MAPLMCMYACMQWMTEWMSECVMFNAILNNSKWMRVMFSDVAILHTFQHSN